MERLVITDCDETPALSKISFVIRGMALFDTT